MHKLGTVVTWNQRKEFGILNVDDEERKIAFRITSGCRVFDNMTAPGMTLDEPERTPRIHDKIRFIERTSDFGVPTVAMWCYEVYWQDSKRRIAKTYTEPRYRVLVQTYFRDKKTVESIMPGSEMTLQELMDDSTRGSADDQFAPEFHSGLMVDKRYFQVQQKNGVWAFCEDPRILPIHYPARECSRSNDDTVIENSLRASLCMKD